ncbi:MAG: glycosyltransferase family 39 protein [Planctomycetota bacterium]
MEPEEPSSTPFAAPHGGRRILLLAAALAVAVRVVYVLALREHPRFDAPSMDAAFHLAWAEHIARGDEFQDGAFFRAPLYPLLLGGLVSLLGGDLLGVRLVQCLLGAATAALSVRLAQRVTGSLHAAAWTGALVATSWILVAFDAELLIPTLLVPLLLLALDRMVAWLPSPDVRGALVVGACFGLAAVARPNVLLFMPVLFGWSVLRTRSVRVPLALTLGTLLPIAPVTAHNALEGDATLVATQGGVNLWIGNNPDSDGSTAIVPGTRDGWWEGYYDAIAAAEAAEGRALRGSEVSDHYLSRTLRWWRAEPGAAAAHLGRKARLALSAVELSNNQDVRFTALRTLPVLALSPARWELLLGLGAVGLGIALRERRRGAALLGAFVLVYGASIVLFFVTARFRVPLVPVLCVFSGLTLARAVESARARSLRRTAALLAPALLIAAASIALSPSTTSREALGLADVGRAEIQRGRPLSGLGMLEEAHALSPDNPQIAVDFAQELSRIAGDHGRALALLDATLARLGASPFGQDARSVRLDVMLDAGDAAGALRGADEALASGATDGRLRLARARALAALGRAEEALTDLEDLGRSEPSSFGPALMTARLADALGRTELARTAYRRVVGLERVAPAVAVDEARAALARLGDG